MLHIKFKFMQSFEYDNYKNINHIIYDFEPGPKASQN